MNGVSVRDRDVFAPTAMNKYTRIERLCQYDYFKKACV